MFEIGATLREARERRAITLADAEAATRIRARYLAALEEERFAELPGEAYARSFLREYADFLGLDGQRLAADYELRFATPEPLAVEPVSFQRRGRPGRSWLIALLVLVVAAIIALAVLVPGGSRRTSAQPTAPRIGRRRQDTSANPLDRGRIRCCPICGSSPRGATAGSRSTPAPSVVPCSTRGSCLRAARSLSFDAFSGSGSAPPPPSTSA